MPYQVLDNMVNLFSVLERPFGDWVLEMLEYDIS